MACNIDDLDNTTFEMDFLGPLRLVLALQERRKKNPEDPIVRLFGLFYAIVLGHSYSIFCKFTQLQPHTHTSTLGMGLFIHVSRFEISAV